MSFSEKMRDSLGAEGAKIDVDVGDGRVAAGSATTATVRIRGGTRAAQVDAITLRVIEAQRHWVESSGRSLTEGEAAQRDRAQLMPAWTRRAVAQTRVAVGRSVDPGGDHELAVEVAVPADCARSSESVAITVNVQADIKGQIDPTGNCRLTVT